MTRLERLLVVASWSLLSCRPTPEEPNLGQIGDPAPPEAPVLETLTDYGIVDGDARAGTDALPDGAIVSAHPKGEASSTEPVVIEFSTPMKEDPEAVEFAFEPHVFGEAKWTSPTRLTFQPTGVFSPARTYTVHVEGKATTRGGKSVSVDERWSFETPRPTVQIESGYADYDGDERDRVSWKTGFDIYLSEPASAEQLRDALTVIDEGKGPVRYRLVGDFPHRGATTSRQWELLPHGHWPADATIKATAAPTLTTMAGPLPSGKEVFSTLRTRAGVVATIECDDKAKDGCVIGSFDLSFDAPLPLAAAKQIRVSPRPKDFEPKAWTWRDDGTFTDMTFFGEFEAGKGYTVHLGKAIRDVYGQPLAGSRTRTVSFVAPPPALDFRGSGTQLTTRGGNVGVESRSLEDATLFISTLDNDALAALAQRTSDNLSRPGRGVTTQRIDLDLTPGGTWGWDARQFDLAKTFGAKTGAALFELVPGKVLQSQRGRADLEDSNGFVQLTNLGVMVAKSPAGGFVRVLSLDTAEPVAGATAHVYGKSFPPSLIDSVGPSDARGMIHLPKGTPLSGGVVHVVVVETKDDRVALGLHDQGKGTWRSYNLPAHAAEFDVGVLMPDRELYQPGERMRLMGWTARSTVDTAAGIKGSGKRPVVVELKDSSDEVIATAKVRTKGYGKFWATLDIPDDAKLGYASIRAVVDGNDERAFTRGVAFREFKAPAFDVSLALDDTELRHGQQTRASAIARYLHGMPLPVAKARRRMECRPSWYRPVNSDEYQVASPATTAAKSDAQWAKLERSAALDNGRMSFDVEPRGLTAGHPYKCTVSLLTMDAARQEVSASATAWVHPSHYLMLAHDERHTRVGEARTIRARAVLPSGASTTAKPAKAEIFYRAEGKDPEKRHTCKLEFNEAGTAECSWTPREGGAYEVVLSGTVDGVAVRHQYDSYVRGRPHKSEEEARFGVAVPGMAKVGDTIDVDVQTRRPKGNGLAIEVHAGIRAQHPFAVRDNRGSYDLLAKDSWVPRGYVDTAVVYPDEARRLPGVDYSFDSVDLGYESRALEVLVTNPEVASIGSTLPIDVSVVGPDGEAVEDAHVSVWAVDEGILILREWRFPDFTRALAVDRGNEARYFDGYDALRRPYVLRGDPYEAGAGGSGELGGTGAFGRGSGGGGGAMGTAHRPQTRRNFDPAPIFIGDVKTGPEGTARVHGVLPDNLTTFRIAAVATAEVAGTGAFARAGRSESRVRVTQDLSIRPVLPRVLRPGDAGQLGVLVDNLTDVPGDLEIEVELRDAQGLARITSDTKIRQRLDDSQVRVPVDVEALRPGELRVWVSATLTTDDGRTLQDASELPLEVRAERTLIRHAATYGSFDDQDAGAVALDIPDHIPASAEASVDVYASLLGGYKDSVDGLVEYPYGCVEQTSSRLVPLAALHGLGEFDFGVENVDVFIEAGLARLKTMVTPSGGFAYWPGGKEPHPYATAYAIWVLSELKQTGVRVEAALIENAAGYLKAELERIRGYATPTAYDDVRAVMALMALGSVGRRNSKLMDALLSRTETLPVFSRAMLAMALHEADPNDARLPELLESIRARIDLRGKVARSKAESKRYTEYFDSPLRSDAIILLALTRVVPDDPLIEPLARGLTEARDRGALRNTQENAFALLAMSEYAELRESIEPDMDVRAWIGADMVVDTTFEGRDLSVLRGETGVEDDPLVTLQRLGKGRLYYRVGMQWAPKPETIEARARGIAIERRLYDTEGMLGSRALVAGESGTLEVVITSDARHRYVAIDIPIPAGIETVDRTLGRGGVTHAPPGSSGGAWLPYNHRELRGDRVLVFVDQLPAGTYRYRVPVRATHEGTYSMPPATVHAMYSPEASGNTIGRKVRVISP